MASGNTSSLQKSTAQIRDWARQSKWQLGLWKLRELSSSSVRGDTFLYNAGISLVEKARRWRDAIHLVQEMIGRGARADIASYGTALSAMSKRHRWRSALRLLQVAKGQQLQPNIISYNTAMNAAFAMQAWVKGTKILESALLMDLKPSTISCNSRMLSEMAAGRWLQALEACKSICGQYSLQMDETSLGSITSAFAFGNQWQGSLRALHNSMSQNAGDLINRISINTAIGACIGDGLQQWMMACNLLSFLTKIGLKPDLVSFSSVANACSSMALWSTSLAIFRSPQHERDSHLQWFPAIRDAARGAYWEEVWKLLDDMGRKSLQWEANGFSPILSSALRYCGLWQRSCHWLGFLRLGDGVDDAAFNGSFAASIGSNSWRLLLSSLRGASASSVRNALLATIAEMHAWRRCLGMFWDTLANGEAWDLVGCFGQMASFQHPNTWELCIAYLQLMPSMRVTPHEPAYRCAVRACGLAPPPAQVLELSLSCLKAVAPSVASRSSAVGVDGTVTYATVGAFESHQVPWDPKIWPGMQVATLKSKEGASLLDHGRTSIVK
eukprot:symbB.v1.2.003805.t1/scaffold192.1/size616647/16